MVLFWEKNWITEYSCQIVYFLRHAWWIIWWIMNTFIMDEMISCDFPMLEWFCYGKKEARSLYQFIILRSFFWVHEVNILWLWLLERNPSVGDLCLCFYFVVVLQLNYFARVTTFKILKFKILLIYTITCLTFSAFTLLCFVYKTWYFNLNESIFGNSIFCIFHSTSDIC